MDSTTAAFVKHARALLAGASPDGQAPEIFKDWADVVRALHDGHANDGTPGVRQALNSLLPRYPELVQLLSGDHDQKAANPPSARDQDDDDAPSESPRRSVADRLIRYALGAVDELFVDQFGQAHVMVDGQALPLPRGCYPWLRRLFYTQEERGATGEALQVAAGTLEAKALAEGETHELHVRSAWHQSALYIELQPGCVVRVDAYGWERDEHPPVRFRRYVNLGVLPDPKRGGTLDGLFSLLPVKTDADRRLLRAYLATGLLPHIPRPMLLLTGPQGAAKSSTQRLIQRVLDPGRPESIRLDPREVIQKAAHCQVALFDNLSHLQDWAIDILCRLVTGEGDSKRRLYSDDEDVIYELRRLVLINGINPPADRPDFTDRCLPIELERLDDGKRMTEERLWASVALEHPQWLGALLTLLTKALACWPRVQLSRFPRLADWATFAAAIYEAAGEGAEKFLTDWDSVVKRQHQAVVEGSPVALALLTFMDQRASWSGTASQLYDQLTPVVEGLKLANDRAWPRSAKGLGRRLAELHPVLKDLGLICERDRTPGGERHRIVTLKKVQQKGP
jgi:hypothetical protein